MNKQDKIQYVSEESDDSSKKVEKIKNHLKQCEQERAEYLAGWQRAKADLINYRKEQEAKISEIFKFANEGLIYEILPILDSFEIAIKFEDAATLAEGKTSEPRQRQEGIKQLYNQLKGILKNQGLEEISAVGEKFNPEFHEAIGEVEGKESGVIAEETQKGYKFNSKVIRASKVKVNK
ncbi:MAG TPA: nucleotide exchange factor GrpE [Candidatus Portnoybacteria bacterium]|jgi:molecular chaperone GrpE|nr:nucleotide exchange factor GrpE [Candidatus Portnoybacteria bacterium]MDD5752392.1 nucleotide exchange factor GrpE [Candidatus Portnoybacteria bacterium]HNU96913.1 nucleotide exchange factor GrpE [Candidatus Portnoybacteria bacterium]HOZ16632.1 nucleotide exchange factor GrpE [Candidatus Portnoybacteria bacterium]HPH52158.1 nucleotide exchange factor GrpE [Candidatus Portnoybacteria bacterium]